MKPVIFAGLLVVLALLLAGCGAAKKRVSTSFPSGQGGQGPQVDQQAFARFQQCLQDHGVNLPSGRPHGGQAGQRPNFDAKTQKAFRACRQYLPSPPQGGGGFGGQGGQGSSGPST